MIKTFEEIIQKLATQSDNYDNYYDDDYDDDDDDDEKSLI